MPKIESTHLPLMPHISVNQVSIDSGNGLLLVWCQAITWTNADLLSWSIGPLGTNFSDIWVTRQIWGIWKLRPAYSPEMPNLGQNRWCFVPCDLEIEGWPWKTIGHLFFAVSSFVQHFIAIGEFKLELQSGNAQFESNSKISRAMWPWNLTDDLEKQ